MIIDKMDVTDKCCFFSVIVKKHDKSFPLRLQSHGAAGFPYDLCLNSLQKTRKQVRIFLIFSPFEND